MAKGDRSVQALATKTQRNVIRRMVLQVAGEIRQREASVMRVPTVHARSCPHDCVLSARHGTRSRDVGKAKVPARETRGAQAPERAARHDANSEAFRGQTERIGG